MASALVLSKLYVASLIYNWSHMRSSCETSYLSATVHRSRDDTSFFLLWCDGGQKCWFTRNIIPRESRQLNRDIDAFIPTRLILHQYLSFQVRLSREWDNNSFARIFRTWQITESSRTMIRRFEKTYNFPRETSYRAYPRWPWGAFRR